jgi:hypothetical protein
MLSGCAGISPQQFYQNPSAASDYEVCKSLTDQAGGRVPYDREFAYQLRMELKRRNVSEGSCPEVIQTRNNAVAAGIIGTLAVVAVVAAAKNGGGGSADASSYAPTSDYSWEWDEYYRNGVLVWSCRGVQTGQFADNYRCANKAQIDWKWPSKSAG